MNYSPEQLRRLAHLQNGGTLANYDRSHYPKKGLQMKKLFKKFYDTLFSDTWQALALFIGIVTIEISILAYFYSKNGY